MRKRMLSLILAIIMVCTMMIPAVSAAEVSSASSAETVTATASHSSTRSDGSVAQTELIIPYNYDPDGYEDNRIEVTNRLFSVRDQGNIFIVGAHTESSVKIKTAESISIKVYAGTETLDYETFYSNYYTEFEFQAMLRDQDGSEANRATATFILRFGDAEYPPFSRRLEISFDYTNGRSVG